jgi:hypothetical protein
MVDYTWNRHSGDEITGVQSTYLQNVYSFVMSNSYGYYTKEKYSEVLLLQNAITNTTLIPLAAQVSQ